MDSNLHNILNRIGFEKVYTYSENFVNTVYKYKLYCLSVYVYSNSEIYYNFYIDEHLYFIDDNNTILFGDNRNSLLKILLSEFKVELRKSRIEELL